MAANGPDGPPVDLEPFGDLQLDLLAVLDLDGRLLWASRGWAALLPGGASDLDGRPLLELVEPADRDAAGDALARLRAGERIEGLRLRIAGADGPRWLEWHAQRAGEALYATARDVSERERALAGERSARAALERSERLYRSLVDAQRDLIVRVDAENRFVFVNEAYCRAFGRRREELLGSSFTPLVHEDDLGATLRAMEELRRPPHRCRILQRAWTVDGWRWLEWHDQAVVDEDGAIVEVQGVGRDVTEEHEREHALRSQQRSLQEATSLAMIGRWDFDHVRDRLHWSDAVFHVFEVERGAFAPSFEAFLERVHQDDREFVATAYRDALERRRAYDIEHRIVTPDGRTKWVRELAEVEFGGDGRPLRTLGVVQDVSYRKLHDPLTGLANALQLQHRLEEVLDDARARGEAVAVCSLDVDRFADLNAGLGRGRADRVLMTVAERLVQTLREDDLVVRTGGDEFVLVLSGLHDPSEARAAVERALRSLARPVRLGEDEVRVTVSAGMAVFPQDDTEADTLKRHADQAMQIAKSRGRDRLVQFDPDVERREHERRARLGRLRAALDAGELEVHVQPTVALADGAHCGVEALVRWRHPERGLRGPVDFLEDVLGGPLEIELGRHVLDEALRAWSDWRRSGPAFDPTATVSVNVGAHQLLTPGFVEDVQRALARHPDVAPHELQIEVLESAALADVERARAVLARCRALGVQIALDDFGTGYSSLSYFRDLPIDTLKIDRTFVAGMLDDAGDLGIVQSVIGLARAFDRQVVAEGVETLDQAAALRALGAGMGQGFEIARPMPADAFPGWARGWDRDGRFDGLPDRLGVPVQELPVRVALRSHRLWMERVVAFAHGGEVELPPLDRKACAFGTWYYGSGSAALGGRPGYADLEPLHERIHDVAERLVERADRSAGARGGPGAGSEAASDAVTRRDVERLEGLHARLVAGLEALLG
jgi:diguanylate cyclase (GGDEF)-like protein/PAS domain S-box-containing protein